MSLDGLCSRRGERIEELVRICEEKDAEIDRLQAIVDKLPRTADGVPVVPNVDSVWVLQADEWRECRLSPLGGAIGADASECYSSLEAAKKAEEDVT